MAPFHLDVLESHDNEPVGTHWWGPGTLNWSTVIIHVVSYTCVWQFIMSAMRKVWQSRELKATKLSEAERFDEMLDVANLNPYFMRLLWYLIGLSSSFLTRMMWWALMKFLTP